MSREDVMKHYQQENKVENYRKDRFLTIGGKLVDRAERSLILRFFERVKNRDRVLDVGTGTGRVALWLGSEKVGVDSSTHMLRKARRAGLDVVCADFNSLPFRADSFSIVVAVRVFIRVESPMIVFKEVARVLRSGGYFIFDTSNKFSIGYFINRLSQEPPHNMFSRGDIQEYLRLATFDVVETKPFFLIPRGVYQKVNRPTILRLWRIERLLLKARISRLACTLFWQANMKHHTRTEAA